jgi:hypothetical protein
VDTPEYQWQQLFWDALIDVGPESYPERLGAADDAVFRRLLELEGTPATGSERLALENTIQDLRLMRNTGKDFRVSK